MHPWETKLLNLLCTIGWSRGSEQYQPPFSWKAPPLSPPNGYSVPLQSEERHRNIQREAQCTVSNCWKLGLAMHGHTFSVRSPLSSKILAQFSWPGNRRSVNSTSGFCSQMWLWMCTPVSFANSPSSLSSCGEQVGANRGVITGCMSGFCEGRREEGMKERLI